MSPKPSQQHVSLDISWAALFKVLAFVVGIWAVITLREVLIMLFGVFIFVAAVNPTIARWQRQMSRSLAVALFYSIMAALVVVISSVLIPQLVHQINELLRTFPAIIERSHPFVQSLHTQGASALFNQATVSVENSLQAFSHGLVDTTFSIFGSLATLVTGLVISFYLLLEEKNAREFFHQVLPQNQFEAVYRTVSEISERMGSWVRGQVLLMFIIGFSNLVGYSLIGLHSPLPLALWSGLCEVIPFVGPFLGVFPALVVAFTTGTVLQVVLVVVVYILIQQIEAHIVVPKIMGRAVGLSPVLVIISLVIGAKLLGLIGAVLAIPVAAIISVVVAEWPQLRKLWESAG